MGRPRRPLDAGGSVRSGVEHEAEGALTQPGRDGALRRPRMDAQVDSSSRTPQRGVPTRPIRKRLAHDVPLWIDPSKARYFITVCCKRRGKNQLAIPDPGYAVLETIIYRHARGIWYASSGAAHAGSCASDRFFSADREADANDCQQMEGTAAKSFRRSNGSGTSLMDHRLAKGRKRISWEKADYILAQRPGSGWASRKGRGLALCFHCDVAMVGTARCAVRERSRSRTENSLVWRQEIELSPIRSRRLDHRRGLQSVQLSWRRTTSRG